MNRRQAISIACFLAALLALCTTFVLPRVLPTSHEAKCRIARGEISSLSTALKLYRLHTGVYPTTGQGLDALVVNPGVPSWHGPYVDRLLTDPWGTPYQYSVISNAPAVASAGPDRRAGTPDDITD